MNFRNLGRTGLKVAEICLGTMQWGWTADEDASFAVMDAYYAAGGNFIDTADIYSNWAVGNPGGVSEEIIGRWLQARGNRDQIVLATKVRGRMWEGPNGEGLSRVHIIKACEDSLRRLQTDYIDLYQTHAYDAGTPVEETLAALDTLVRQGKVRYVGCSNYPAWRLMHALWASDKYNLVRFDALQPHYNLLHRAEFERELKDVSQHFGLGVIPYSPLANGFLTGKYRRQAAAASARAAGVERRYMNARGFALLEVMDAIAARLGASVLQVALAWQLHLPWVTSPIIGANSVTQLEESLGALAVTLTDGEMQELDAATAWQ